MIPDSAPIRLLLVDDDTLVRAGLRTLLDAEPDLEVVGEVGDGAEVTPAVTGLRRAGAGPDVVLMDVRMPAVDGISATRHLVERVDPPPKVLVVTTFDSDAAVFDALRVGASGFVLKRARPDEIADAVRTVTRGDSLLFPAAIRDLARAHVSARHGRGLGAARLTDREQEVLRAMAGGRSNAEIAEELVLGVQTVKTHVASVLGKLGARDRTQAVVIAYESGFIDPRRR